VHVVERFAEFALGFGARPIPADALHHAKRAVIDWYAALLPGAAVAPATLLEKALAQDLDRGGSTPEEFGRYMKDETAKWAKIVKASGAKAD